MGAAARARDARRVLSDREILRAVAWIRRPALDRLVAAYSACGNQGVCWVAAGVVLSVRRRSPRPALATAATVWGTLAVNYAVKQVVRRDRPDGGDVPEPLIEAPRSHSFPSSHAAMSVAACFVLPRPVIGAAALMAASRVYLAVHWPSDVAAGAALGAACGTAAGMLGA
jgi:membrane-associated phospholipid phosphatase